MDYDELFAEKKIFTQGGSALLNLPSNHSIAAISFNVEVYAERSWSDGGVQISDCSRSINLDLSFESEEQHKNALYKLDTLIRVLQEAREAVESAEPIRAEAAKRLAKKRKKKENKEEQKKELPKIQVTLFILERN